MKLERAEWGNDLPSVELQLETQQHIHTSVEDLGSSVKEARLYEVRTVRIHYGRWGGAGNQDSMRSGAVPKEKVALEKHSHEQHFAANSRVTELVFCSMT